MPEAYTEPCQACEIELFAKIAALINYQFCSILVFDTATKTPLDAIIISTDSSLGSYCKFLKVEEFNWKNVSSHSSVSKLLLRLLNRLKRYTGIRRSPVINPLSARPNLVSQLHCEAPDNVWVKNITIAMIYIGLVRLTPSAVAQS